MDSSLSLSNLRLPVELPGSVAIAHGSARAGRGLLDLTDEIVGQVPEDLREVLASLARTRGTLDVMTLRREDLLLLEAPPATEEIVAALRRRLDAKKAAEIAAADELEHLVLAVLAQPLEAWVMPDHNKSYHDPDGRYRPHPLLRPLIPDDYQGRTGNDPRVVARRAEAQASVRAQQAEWQIGYDAWAGERATAYEAAKTAKTAAEQAAREEREAWISEHGSERLRLAVELAIEHERVYLDERLAHDLPGWSWGLPDDLCGGWVTSIEKPPRNPPLRALQALQALQATKLAEEAGVGPDDVELLHVVLYRPVDYDSDDADVEVDDGDVRVGAVYALRGTYMGQAVWKVVVD